MDRIPPWLPTPVALPWQRATTSPGQRKDLLRVTLENLLSLLGAVAVGDLLDAVANLEEPEDSKKDPFVDRLHGDEADDLLKGLRGIGLEQMSLGKWVALLRTLDEFVTTNKLKVCVPEALAVYGKAKKDVDELVKRRNDDAHGPAILPEALGKELDAREAMLERIVGACAFLKTWHVEVFDRFEVVGDSQVFFGTRFGAAGPEAVRVSDPKADLPLGDLLLVDAKRERAVSLSPLAVASPPDDGGDLQAAVYSKELKGGADILYLGVDGAVTVNMEGWGERHGDALAERRRAQQRLFREPRVQTPDLALDLKLASTSLVVGEDATDLTLKLANRRGGTDIENARVFVSLPQSLAFAAEAGPADHVDVLDERRLAWRVDDLGCGHEMSTTLRVEGRAAGSETLPPLLLEYAYRRTEDAEAPDAEGAEEIPGLDVEVIDPAFEDPLRPVINVERRARPLEGAEAIVVGDQFEFEVEVANIGLGRANNVTGAFIPPDGMEVLDGDQTIALDLPPGTARTLRWQVRAVRSGVHRMRVSDLVYTDLPGRRYATACSEDWHLLVRADKRKQLRFLVGDFLQDLVISDDEEAHIATLLDGLQSTFTEPGERESLRGSSESDAVVAVVRRLVEEAGRGREVRVTEALYTESVWQEAKHAERGKRRLVVFSAANLDPSGVPFFAIDITEGAAGRLFFHSLPVRGLTDKEPFTVSEERGVYGSTKTLNGPLAASVAWLDIRTDATRGRAFFKGWIARLLRSLEDEMLPWSRAAGAFARRLGGTATYLRLRYEIRVPDAEAKADLCIQDTKEVAPRRCCAWAFRAGDKGRYHLVVNIRTHGGVQGKTGLTRLKEFIAGSDLAFHKPLLKEPGDLEESPKPTGWLGATVQWRSAEDDAAVEAAVAALVKATRYFYMHDVSQEEAACFKGKPITPLAPDDDGMTWLTRRAGDLAAAGLAVRVTSATNPLVKNTIEFHAAGVAGGRRRVVGRLLSGKGAGEAWLTWYEGMSDDLAVLDDLEVESQRWEVTGKVPPAVNPGLLLRIDPERLDEAAFGRWVDALIAAAGAGAPAWPSRFRPELARRAVGVEPALPAILRLLEDGPRELDALLAEAGKDGKAWKLAVNRLLYWRDHYGVLSPLVDGTDGIGITPALRDDLLAAIDSEGEPS